MLISMRGWREGDLLFFDQDGKKTSHVGMYLGKGRFIHAPSSGGKVRIDSVDAEFWKSHLLLPETPRRGDTAAVVKDHHGVETGLLVKVTNDPVFGSIYCNDCGQRVDDWVVEIQVLDDMGREPPEGIHVYAYPVKWLQRVLPMGHADASKKQVAFSSLFR